MLQIIPAMPYMWPYISHHTVYLQKVKRQNTFLQCSSVRSNPLRHRASIGLVYEIPVLNPARLLPAPSHALCPLQSVENCVCIMRNLSYHVHKEVPGAERFLDPSAPQAPGSAATQRKKKDDAGCFGGKKAKGEERNTGENPQIYILIFKYVYLFIFITSTLSCLPYIYTGAGQIIRIS